MINCCVTSHKKQNSFESYSNIKVSEFKFEESSNASYAKTKKFQNFNQKSPFQDESNLRSQETKKRLLKGFKSIIGCFDSKKNENLSNLDEFSKKITQKLHVFQKAKEKFNKKFRKILEKNQENEFEKFNETDLAFSLTNSNARVTLGDKEKNIKNPTFSYSDYNVIDNMTIFSNSLEKTE